jgi:polyisoprenoid-binding protein YceI
LVDDPTGRAQAGPDFAKQPEPDAVAGTRRNMLGDGVLDASDWPEVQISARVGDLDATASTARVFIRVRGVSNGYETPVQIESGAGEVRVSGSLTLRQRDFGITPFAVLGGALRVQDAIRADFVVVGRKSGDAMW